MPISKHSGQVTRITDPRQTVTNVAYSGTRKTIIDAGLRTTLYDYEDIPGRPTKVTDALGQKSVHAYDAIGRLVNVVFDGATPPGPSARVHEYAYDWLDNVLSEPSETGSITYFYNPELRLDRKTWGLQNRVLLDKPDSYPD
jgi:YD repeat-containing protein